MKPLKLITTVVVTVISATFLAWTAQASLIWSGDPSQGLGVFKVIDIEDANNNSEGNPSPNGSSVGVITDPTYGQVFQFYKASADKRAEAHGAAGFNPATGNTYFIGWRFKINSTVTDNAIFQWKAYGSPMYQNFPIVLKYVSGALELHYYSSNEVDHVLWSQAVAAGSWHSAVIEIKVSSSWTGGSISFWFDGSEVVTAYAARTFDGSSVDPKWGIYGAIGTQVTDDVGALAIGTTYNDVAPGGGFAGTYEIQNVTSGKVLNQGGSLTNGSPISQWTQGTSDNLKFTFIPTSNGYYQINSVKSGLDVVVQGAATTNNAPLIQWSFGSSGDDQWLPVQNSDGTWTFYNLHSGLVLNNTGGSTANGTQYSQWSWANSPNEKFNLIPQ